MLIDVYLYDETDGLEDDYQGDGFYFWDEVQAHCIGPYPTATAATQARQEYSEQLNRANPFKYLEYELGTVRPARLSRDLALPLEVKGDFHLAIFGHLNTPEVNQKLAQMCIEAGFTFYVAGNDFPVKEGHTCYFNNPAKTISVFTDWKYFDQDMRAKALALLRIGDRVQMAKAVPYKMYTVGR